jgi:hypothetical protein
MMPLCSPSGQPLTNAAEVDEFLAILDPNRVTALRNALGGDVAADLGKLRWLLQAYGDGQPLDSDTSLIRLGSAIGRGVHADLQSVRHARTRLSEPCLSPP